MTAGGRTPREGGVSARLLLGAMLFAPATGHAGLGLFEHGAGIIAQGFGGISYAIGSETSVLGANPAHAMALGNRFDIGIGAGTPTAEGRIRDNAADDDSHHDTGTTYFFVPQGGWARPLGERWSVGVSLLNAGLGPSYDRNPYARFGGGPEAELDLGQSSLINALAFRLNDDHTVAASINISYQTL